jgi:RNA-directed DNA polymerase
LYRALGYSPEIATILALLCTAYDTTVVEIDRQTLHIAKDLRKFPQGAPTSPGLANALCRNLDGRLRGMAAKLGDSYTRYADDLSFSSGPKHTGAVGKLLWRGQRIIADEGFLINDKKTRVLRKRRTPRSYRDCC